MSRLTGWMDRTFYPDYGNNWDDEIFRRVLEERIDSDKDCLDCGAGRGKLSQMNFRGIAKSVTGIDLDEAIFENPNLDEARLIDPDKLAIPYADNKFDVVFSDNVVEHVEDPDILFNEVFRVLKPGGVFLSKTTNKWHYMPLIATLTPTSFHKFYNRLRGRHDFDTFPTVYRSNSRSAVRHYANEASFEVRGIWFFEGRPEYLRLNALTYLLGLLYERFVNLTDRCAIFRCVMIFELRKSP